MDANNGCYTDHCLDFVRQEIQCFGDMTPIPTKWIKSLGRDYSDSNNLHTCRDFSELRSWTTERHNGSTSIPDKNGNFQSGSG
jgi:hypothetical protein